MLRIDLLLNDLVEAANAQRLSKRALARKADLHPNTLLKFGETEFSPSIDTIRSLEHALLQEGSGD